MLSHRTVTGHASLLQLVGGQSRTLQERACLVGKHRPNVALRKRRPNDADGGAITAPVARPPALQ
jgi:hypothetical protein